MNPRNLNRLQWMPGLCLAVLGCFGLAASTAVLAAKADRDLPVDIDAGHWVDDPEKEFVLFNKGVIMDQGTLHIEAEKAMVYRDDEGGTYSRIVLVGKPARWSETLDDGALMKAQANHIDYDVSNDTVVLRGDVIINKDGDLISGEIIRYNLDTQLLSAGSDNNGSGRIKMTISPKKKSGN